MLKICHRINTITQLQQILPERGVELDLHAFGNRLVVHHDSFTDGLDFEEWLQSYNHQFVIVNIKEEGIEALVLALLSKYQVSNFFMLDLSFPALMKMINSGEKRVALRVSHYESVESALSLAGKLTWIWLDLFHDELPLNNDQFTTLRELDYKICLVSPELHGRDKSSILKIQTLLTDNHWDLDAVCTKHPELW